MEELACSKVKKKIAKKLLTEVRMAEGTNRYRHAGELPPWVRGYKGKGQSC